MSVYTTSIHWARGDQLFTDNRYSRAHVWKFDGGIEVPASSSPSVVPVPMSRPEAVDPEEAFVASLASCHMLWFLSLAAKQGFIVDDYDDAATGQMGRNQDAKLAMTNITLRPLVTFSGHPQPNRNQIIALHHQAHDECFIANSVRTAVACEPRFPSNQSG